MLKTTLILATCVVITVGKAAAQTRPSTLSTLFDDVFGANGLVVSSDDVQLDGTNHAAHFNSSFQSDFRLMNIALTSQLTAVPVPSPASGFTYKFDPSTGTFVRSTRSFGPILADRGETIGRGRIAFGTNLQFFSFDRLDGVVLSDIPAVFRHDNYRSTGGRSDVIATRNTIQATGHGTSRQFFASGDAGGVGDILLRAKGTVMREGRRSLAAGVDLRLPTGDEQNLLGSGAPGVRPFAALSASYGVAAPHVNVAYQWNGRSVLAGDVREGVKADMPDQFQYAAGTDLTVNPRLSLLFDVIGQRLLHSPRLSTFAFLAEGPAGRASLRDLEFQTASFWTTSGSVGLKANLASRLLINFNLRFAIGKAGLTDRVTPLLGLEWAF